MSAKRTGRPLANSDSPRGRADRGRLRGLTEREIAASSPAELRDLPAGFWNDADLVVPARKRAISLRVDEDVLDWFRSLGPRYQTRMNAVLRSYMDRARTPRPRPRARRPAQR